LPTLPAAIPVADRASYGRKYEICPLFQPGDRSGSRHLPDATRRLLAIAHKNGLRLVRLVNDILDIEKMESGRVAFKFGRVQVRSLVEQAIEANRGFAEDYGVRIRLEDASAFGDVRADPDRLAQVVTNLLSNAIKFSPAENEVVVGIQKRTGVIRLSVRDHVQVFQSISSRACLGNSRRPMPRMHGKKAAPVLASAS